MESEKEEISKSNGASKGNQKPVPEPKKSSKVFLVILIVMLLLGAWFGISKYTYDQHHEETDDAQIEADIIPVIPRVSGYVKEIRVNDNQFVHKGDTLIVIDDRDLKMKLLEAEAALSTAKSNVDASRANTQAARSGIATSQAGVYTINAQIEAAKVNLTRATQDYDRYANPVSYTHLRAHETGRNLVCRLL